MKILFLTHDLMTVPLGVSYISTVSKLAGHSVTAAALNESDLLETVMEFAPDVVAFGCTTGFHRKYLEAVDKIRKDFDVITVMGGAHPTFFPETLEENDQLDFIVIGEAEEAFLQLLEALEGKRKLESVGNLRYIREGNVIQNPLLPLCEDLDSIPFPDRKMLGRYEEKLNSKAIFVITGRGCPYDCSYCFNHSFNRLYKGLGRMCRRRSVENVIQEIEKIRSDNPELQMVIFQDDIFILEREWVFEFCRVFTERIGLPFHCHLRANLVDGEITAELKKAGCVSVKMAIESASDRLRNGVLNRNMSRETIEKACRAVKDAGIVLVTQNILGIPTGTLEDDLETLALNCSIEPDFAFATLLQPYPKTEIGRFCIENGFMEEKDSADAPDSFFDCSILRIPDRNRRERLRKLFALAIEYPMLRDNIRTFIDLPLDPVYDIMDKLWKGYCIKQREFPYKLKAAEYIRSVITYFRSRYY
ncbi:MAG: radical SAM protein [Candidatus Aegiribacteria sp.]|nr:radical SAM protein [Candidatus Aegiribacteria sp.]